MILPRAVVWAPNIAQCNGGGWQFPENPQNRARAFHIFVASNCRHNAAATYHKSTPANSGRFNKPHTVQARWFLRSYGSWSDSTKNLQNNKTPCINSQRLKKLASIWQLQQKPTGSASTNYCTASVFILFGILRYCHLINGNCFYIAAAIKMLSWKN